MPSSCCTFVPHPCAYARAQNPCTAPFLKYTLVRTFVLHRYTVFTRSPSALTSLICLLLKCGRGARWAYSSTTKIARGPERNATMDNDLHQLQTSGGSGSVHEAAVSPSLIPPLTRAGWTVTLLPSPPPTHPAGVPHANTHGKRFATQASHRGSLIDYARFHTPELMQLLPQSISSSNSATDGFSCPIPSHPIRSARSVPSHPTATHPLHQTQHIHTPTKQEARDPAWHGSPSVGRFAAFVHPLCVRKSSTPVYLVIMT